MFSEIQTGTLGAKVQSFRRLSPREILARVLRDMPTSQRQNRKAAYDAFLSELEKSSERDEIIDAILEYWFSNHYRIIIELEPQAKASASGRTTSRVSELKGQIGEAIEAKAKEVVLLDLVMPNGKLLRGCTGSDCKNASGWFGKIAKRIKPDDIVGKVFTENDLREIRAG